MKSISSTLDNGLHSSTNALKLKPVRVLLVGNNPLELAQCSEQLVNFKKRKFDIDIAFSNDECYKETAKHYPSAIIIDDSVGFMNLMEITSKLHKDSRFHKIPLIVIKNSNYYHAGISGNVIEFILKDNLPQLSLPELILITLQTQSLKEKESSNNLPPSLDQKMSRLFMSLFSSKRG